MPNAQATTSRSTRSAAARETREAPDAITLLTDDHKEVKKLFRQYDKLAKAEAQASQRQEVAERICLMLTVHAQIEEELLYPAAREVLPEADLVDEAAVEHQSAKDLIAQIRGMTPDEPLYDAKVKVLGEYIDHHVKEEQDELFPKLRRRIDIKAIGAALMERKQALMAEEADGLH
ncbi:hemerythrin domain-containing protein [Aquincola sp. MAHUQ-54]|uniref:Hemerythrin domain-containing protein n=1 Tax=Aquincola agrisoli TaxID=3119538 RepID=A0AAW9QFJ7_9BURK